MDGPQRSDPAGRRGGGDMSAEFAIDPAEVRAWKRYPEYKDSGVEWLGEVPAGWEIQKLKRQFRIVNGGTPASSEATYWDGDITWFTPEDLGRNETKRITSSGRQITREGLQNCSAQMVPCGSIILSTRAPIGHIAVTDVEACTNQGCRSLVPLGTGIATNFSYYVLFASKMILQAKGKGTTFTELSTGDLGSHVVPSLPLPEQHAIATFLDRETARIDALIERKQRFIELLEEKRQALITQAVTKGLDPDVEMKDSGVEWLGDVPVHWQLTRLKFLSTLQTGLTLGKKYGDQPLVTRPYLRVANVQEGYFDLTTITEIAIPPKDVTKYELLSGDVLMTEGGDFDKLGRGYVWEGQIPDCLHQNHIFAVRLTQSKLKPHFLAVLLTSAHGKNYFTSTSQQTTNLATTNSTKLRNFSVFLPPLAEQEEIIAFIQNQSGIVQGLITGVKKSIEKLHEYRTALISAAVTGKIDVRGEVPAAP